LFDHFGSAPFFTLYDSSTGKTEVLDNRNAHHSPGACHPLNQLTRYHIDCVVCAGMGRRAIEALGAGGIRVYKTQVASVGEIIEQLKSDRLSLIDPAKACPGHGQRGGCGHEAGSEPGRGEGFGHPGGGRGQGGRG
jgi:predicted Fe-Mo cluster-binding NifX family protein